MHKFREMLRKAKRQGSVKLEASSESNDNDERVEELS